MRLVVIERRSIISPGAVLVLGGCGDGTRVTLCRLSFLIVCFELPRMVLLGGSMDKSIVSLRHCVISLFFVPSAIDLVHQPALLMKRPTSQSKVFDTMALVVANPPRSLRCLSPAPMETSYPVRKNIFACSPFKHRRKSTLSRYSLLYAHTHNVYSHNKIQGERAPSHL